LRDDGGGNLLLILLSKTDHSDSMMLSLAIVLAREDVEVHLHAPETKTEHFWRCVWTNFDIEKLHNF
jgi:cytosine/adenosine deaminase-related metal-dependent hydrolase